MRGQKVKFNVFWGKIIVGHGFVGLIKLCYTTCSHKVRFCHPRTALKPVRPDPSTSLRPLRVVTTRESERIKGILPPFVPSVATTRQSWREVEGSERTVFGKTYFMTELNIEIENDNALCSRQFPLRLQCAFY